MKSTILKCIVTGNEKRVSPSSLNNKINKFGSIEMVHKFYVSKEAAKLLKQGNSIDQVRSILKSNFNKSVDLEVLYKLKLFKKGKKRQLSAEELEQKRIETEENERKYYELQEKIKTCSKTWIEWATGNNTCVRPDIYYDYEGEKGGRCRPCPYHEYCLVSNKELK